MKKALGSLTALLLLIVMLPAAAEAAEGRIKYWYASRYTDEGYVWAEQSETWTDTGVTDNGETGRILDTPPDGAELWITNPPVPLTVEGNFSDVYLIGGTVTFLGDIEWLTLFEADWESPDITVYGDIEKITMSPLLQGEMSLRTTGDIGVVYLVYGEEGPFKSFSWYGDGVTMATLMDKGSIQQIGTPEDIYNEPVNAFVADFIGESNILNGTMIHDKLVRFCGTEFECVDEGFGENTPVDVVIRPEDLYIFPVSDMAQLTGVVQTSIFKGVHYEMTVLCGGYEFLVQDYHHFEVGAEVGLLVKPFDIHIMKKERVCNTFEGKMLDATHVEFLGCSFDCTPVENIEPDTNVKVEVDFDKVILQDNEEDGTLTGEVKFILYKGDHYHLTVWSDWDENVFVDTNDVWDDGDRVGITIPPDAIRVVKITD